MSLPFYIQKAADLGLLTLEDGRIIDCNKTSIDTIFGTARLVEKLQPTSIADKDDTTDQEAIILCRVLNSPSGLARELWSQLRTAFGVGHGQELPQNLWSNMAFRAIGKEIDLTFLGERTGKIISKDSIITGYENISKNNYNLSFSDFCTTISELASIDTMDAYGNEKSEWTTALDILKQKRVLSLYKETLYLASQSLKADPKLDKALAFIHERTMESIGMLSGSVGNQGQVIDLSDAICGDPGAGKLNWTDYIQKATSQDKPISTGVQAFDLDMDGGVSPPTPNMPRAGRLLVIGARTGVGKCCSIDTPVIMADGSIRPVQDVREGDLVLGPNGTPRRVYGLARGRSEMYRVTQQSGDAYTVNDAHILSLRVTGGSKNSLLVNGVRYYGGDIVNVGVLDYLKLSQRAKRMLKGWKSGPVTFNGAPSYNGPLTPYLAGAYLGDGHRHSPKLSLSDNEIIEELRKFCVANGYKLHETDEPGCTGCYLSTGLGSGGNPVLNWIRDNDFIGQGKHIPEPLKRGFVQQRLELLAGIIDADGCVSNNCFDITVKEQRFAFDIAFVARSLGLSVNQKECQKGIKSLGFTGVYYRLIISGDTNKVPTRVPRKQCKSRKQVKNVLNTGIKVDSIGVDDYYGFELQGPDKLFLLGDFTVTHNTGLGVHVASSLAKGGLTVGFVSAELESRAIEARIIANLSKALVSPFHWKRLQNTGQTGYVTVGELELPGATKAQDTISQIVAEVAMKLEETGGKLLVESPWGACVDTCINIMRSMKAKQPELRAIVLDHFHALSRHKGGSASNVSAMLEDRAYRLMTAAKELDIDLFVLAQLNRIGMDSTSNPEPQLNEIRGTDALAHVSHATWLIRRVKSDANSVNREIEVWHSKVRGRQAVWKEGKGTLESISGFIDKSVIRMHYETSSVEDDMTASLVKDLESKNRSIL